jgi:hypothetical protein
MTAATADPSVIGLIPEAASHSFRTASMASLSGEFNFQQFTDAGVTLVSGRVYTYAPGTTTHKTAYTDAAGAVPHTYTSDGAGGQYIALNSRGEMPAPLFLSSGGYDIALKRADGTSVWTRRAASLNDYADTIDAAVRADLLDTTDVAKNDALLGVKRTNTGAVATTQHAINERAVLSVFDFMTAAQIADCQSATPTLDHTTAWTAWSTAVQASKGRIGYIPAGTYLIDSWTVNTYGARFIGEQRSAVTLTHGVKIKARSTVTNFVDFSGADDGELSYVELDGNNKATNVFRMSTQTFGFRSHHMSIGGAVNGGINCNLSGATTNTQVAEMSFYDLFLSGSGSRAGTGASGITNLKINSNQTLVMCFHRLMAMGSDAGGTDVGTNISIPLGTVTFYTPFFTRVGTFDMRIGDGGSGGGSITIVDGRSESTTADSIYVDGGSADVTLVNYVHATSAMTGLTLTANFTGRATVIGGQQYNTTNSSATAQVVLINMKTLSGGVIGGAYADRIVYIQDSISVSARRASRQQTVTYSASITLAANQYDRHFIQVTNGTAFTINAPSGPTAHQTIVIDIRNASGGAMGAITWNAVFKMAGAFTNPANNKRRKIAFTYDGTNWIEEWRMAADGDV